MYNVIVDADTDNVIGAIQLISDKKNNSGEIEFTIHPEYWSNGIATDVARTIVKYGFKVLKLNRIWASTDINNTASEIVLQKLKMRHEAILRQNIKLEDGYRDTLVYSILKDEYYNVTINGSFSIRLKEILSLKFFHVTISIASSYVKKPTSKLSSLVHNSSPM